jgi:hypothetical protein
VASPEHIQISFVSLELLKLWITFQERQSKMFNELEAIIGVVAGAMSTQQHGIGNPKPGPDSVLIFIRGTHAKKSRCRSKPKAILW